MSKTSTFRYRLKQVAVKSRTIILFASYIPVLVLIFSGWRYASENIALNNHGVLTSGQIILIGDKYSSRRGMPKYKITYMFKPVENAKRVELLQDIISMYEYEYLGEQIVSSNTRRKFREDQRVSVKYVPLKEFSTKIEPISRISKGAPTFIYIFLFLMGVLMGIFNTILLAYKFLVQQKR